MNEVVFIESRTPDWQRLSQLVEKADVSPKNLTSEELQEIIRLYRKCSDDLATVRTRSSNLQVITFLNDLVARAYSTLYRPKRKSIGEGIAEFVTLAAQTGRKLKFFVLASVLTFLLSAFVSFSLCRSGSEFRHVLEPSAYKDTFDQWKKGNIPERSTDESATATAFYASNNPLVSILMASIGAGSFGVGSGFELWNNGQMIGTLAYEMSTVGKLPFLFGSIMPHGVTELSGMVLAGASGYQLGWALIAPGRRKRRDALRDAGKDALIMLCTAVIMMFMAAPIEGFISFNPKLPMFFKVGFAIFGACAWGAFWLGYGREPVPELAKSQS
jgi:uncharacterized membrane protein SpoIIM required for sporulation